MRSIMTLAMLALTAAAAGAQAPDSGAFVVRLGNDTLVLERFVRTPTRVLAEALIRSPATVLRRYDLRLDNAGGIRRYEAVDVDIASNNMRRRELLIAVGDSAVQLVFLNDSVAERRFALPRQALPFLNLVQWPNELVVARAHTVGDSIIMPYLSGASSTNFVIHRISPDSVTIRHPLRGVTRVHTDRQGRILHMDQSATTLKLAVERQPWLPLETLAPAFAARDAHQQRRELSPRGETRATVDGAAIRIDYGRPLKRGREIFGRVVPYGQHWRTGANMATQFWTDRDLVIDGKTLPAGHYSIFSVPDRRRWTIIINAETNQAGTAHKAQHDVMRVPADVRALPDTIEQFTIAVTDETRGGALRFQWDKTEAVLPFTVK
jgi:hypothetical protein